MKKVATVVLALVAVVFLSAPAVAQQPVQYDVTVKAEIVKGSPNDHFVTFSGPVQIPDVTLPAGTYVFTVFGPSVVQVTSPDRALQYAMFFTAPVERFEATENYEIKIVPTNESAPGRITKWFLPNQTRGFEFLYPEASGDR
jgi:hypothetical protein